MDNMTEQIRLLIQAHLECQRGFYFDELLEFGGGIPAAFSHEITDPYWNFAFVQPTKWEHEPFRTSLLDAFEKRKRTPAVFFATEVNVEPNAFPNTTPFATEIWLTVTENELKPASTKSLSFKSIESEEEVDQAVAVFTDAYTSEVPGVGYTSLPPEYSKAYRSGLMNAKQFGSIQLLGMDAGRPVAVASAFLANGKAGIYNVAVARDAQRKGFGSEISFEVVSSAFKAGTESCFLQTEPNGTVEDMYRKLGFKPQFTGNLIILT
jgi:ribosomal protein S18 acetylase RimI-like enzyme